MKKSTYRLFTIASIFILAGCSAQNADLTCTKIFGENDIIVSKYSFEDGKVYLFDTKITVPPTGIEDPNVFQKEFNKINDITGCTGKFETNEDGSYTSQQVCNFNEMSDEDIQAVYLNTREDLQSTRKEIVKHFEYDDGMKCE